MIMHRCMIILAIYINCICWYMYKINFLIAHVAIFWRYLAPFLSSRQVSVETYINELSQLCAYACATILKYYDLSKILTSENGICVGESTLTGFFSVLESRLILCLLLLKILIELSFLFPRSNCSQLNSQNFHNTFSPFIFITF